MSSPFHTAKWSKLKCTREVVPEIVTVLLRTLGYYVGRYPFWFITVTTVISLCLGASVYWSLDYQTSIEHLYIPYDAESWYDKKVAEELFHMNYSGRFQPDRATQFGSYALVLIYPKDRGNILRRSCFDEVLIVDALVRNISIDISDEGDPDATRLSYTELCARWGNDCFYSETIKLNNVVDKLEAGVLNLTWPVFLDEDAFHYIILPGSIGKPVIVDDIVVSSPAVGLFFILAAGDARGLKRGIKWEEQFITEMQDISAKLQEVDIFFEAKTSVEYEFDSLKWFVPRQGFLAGTVVLVFSVACCLMADWVKAKPWLGVVGVASTVLALIASYGLLMLVGFPFTTTLFIVPFLMLGIGMEDTFLMLASWRKTSSNMPVEKRIEETYAEAAVSMTITSLTNLLSFLIGATSSFRVLNIFCFYSGISILFLYLYQITFYGAWLALCGRWEAENRHSLTGAPIMPLSEAKKHGKSKMYQLFCTGGHSPEQLACGAGEERANHAIMYFFREHFATAIMKPGVQVVVVLTYLVYLGFGIYGCMQLREGLSLQRLVPDDSYYVPFYDMRYADFMDYPYRVPIVVAGHVDYSNKTVQQDLENMLQRVENHRCYAEGIYTDSWLRRFHMIADMFAETNVTFDISNETTFNANLKELYSDQDNPNSLDVVFNEDNQIVASRFIVQVYNLSGLEDVKECMLFLRSVIKEYPQYNVTAYTPIFAFAELLIGATHTAISTVSMAAVVMLVVALVMIPESKCAIYVGISLVSIELGVLGYMSLWGVNLDCVSVGCLVMCIGFSVDFSAHITHSFIAAEGSCTMNKLRDAVESAGLPILQGGASCVLAVLAMIAIPAYVFGIFVKTMFLVMIFGAAHGILLLPILLLHTAGPGKEKKATQKELEAKQYEVEGGSTPSKATGDHHEIEPGENDTLLEVKASGDVTNDENQEHCSELNPTDDQELTASPEEPMLPPDGASTDSLLRKRKESASSATSSTRRMSRSSFSLDGDIAKGEEEEPSLAMQVLSEINARNV